MNRNSLSMCVNRSWPDVRPTEDTRIYCLMSTGPAAGVPGVHLLALCIPSDTFLFHFLQLGGEKH